MKHRIDCLKGSPFSDDITLCTCHSQPSVAEWEEEFEKRFKIIDDDFGDTSWSVKEIREYMRPIIFSAYAQGQQDERERMVGIIEKYFKGLVVIPFPELTKQNLLATIKGEK